MTAIGVFVRAEPGQLNEVRDRLASIEGVETLELEEPGALGLVLKADDLRAAHELLANRVEQTPGVLCAWPVHTEVEGSRVRADPPPP
ncbi:MAG: chaperone NapD [Planctomycetota bacterium]|nr:chaperone NapD [Planctomycetota bacterium]